MSGNVDFISTTQTVVISAGTTRNTVKIPLTKDNVVERNEMFTMNLNVPASLGPEIIAGAITIATATIVDKDSESLT